MADPFSLAASVVGVAVAAFQTSKKLHDLVQDFKEAPGQLYILAEKIERDATLLKCTVELIQDHDALYKDELKGLIRDVNGQFANISSLIDKLLPKSTRRRRDRLKEMVRALWQSKKIEDITLQLEALRSTLALILNVAQFAEQRSSRDMTASAVDIFRAQTSQTIEDCFRSLWNLHNQEHHSIPGPHRKLLTFDESPADMAVWMAVNLSAPTIPTRPLPEPEASGSSVKIVRSRTKAALPFGPVSRAKPRYHRNGGAAGRDVEFRSGALDVRTLQTFGLPYQESPNPDGSSKLVIKREEALKPHEVDMIVGMDIVNKFPRSKTWSIDKTPFMYLPKDIVLCRLLTEWTTLDPRQIQAVQLPLEEEAEIDSDSDGGASTMTSFSDEEAPASTRRRQSTRQPLNEKIKRGPTRFESPRPLADRFSKGRAPYTGPRGYAYTVDGSIDSSSRYPAYGESQKPAPSWAQPGLTQTRQPVAQGQVPFDRSYPRNDQAIPQRVQPLPYSRAPPPPPPPRPPMPPPARPKRNDFAYTVGNDVGEIHRPSTPSMHDSPTTVIDGVLNDVQDNMYTTEARPDPLVELRRRTMGMTPEALGKSLSQEPKAEGNDAKLEPQGDSSRHRAGTSRSETLRPDEWQREQRPISTGRARTRSHAETEEIMRARIFKEVEDNLRANGVPEKDTPPQTQQDLESWRKQLKAEMRQEVEMEFQRQQDLQETYDQAYEKSYADLKRHEAEQQDFIDRIKEQAKAELRQEQIEAEKRAREEQDIRERLRKIAEAEREEAERQHRARQEIQPTEEFIQQSNDHPQGRTADVDRSTLLENAVQRYMAPYVEYDIMSYVTEETESSTTTTDASDSDSDDTDTDAETVRTAVESQEQRDRGRNSDVERSQPWKGAAHLGNFVELTPFYLRGSDAGQTWFHGPEPIYIVEFQAGYDGETAAATQDDDADGRSSQPRKRPYLLVSKLWVDAEALDRFGFKYAEGPPSHFFLDPTLSWDSIEVLVNFTYALREIETFKKHGQGDANEEGLLCRSPPPLDFFTTSETHEAMKPAIASQEPEDDASAEDGNAEETPRSLTSRLTFPLSILNFALRTIT